MMRTKLAKRLFTLLLSMLMTLSLVGKPISVAAVDTDELPEALSERTTESLVAEILNGYYGYNVFLLSTKEQAYSYLVGRYEIFAELETRQDAADILLNHYIGLSAKDPQEMAADEYINCVLLWTMLIQPIYRDCLECAGATASTQNMLMTSAVESDPPEVIGDLYAQWELTDLDVKTLNKNKVYLYYTDDNYPSYVLESLESQIYSECGELTEVASHDIKYNCHSYAWYQRSTNNQYWLNDISPYLDDPHYYEVTPSTAEVGDIVVYTDANGDVTHSAIIYSISTSSLSVPIITCESKMGVCGIYRHNITNIPDSYSNAGTATYKIYSYSATHTYTGAFYQYDSTYHMRKCAYCVTFGLYQHVYRVTSYTTTGHTFTCNVCDQTKTEAHTPDAQTGKCTNCAYTGPVTSNPILGHLPEVSTDSCNHSDCAN